MIDFESELNNKEAVLISTASLSVSGINPRTIRDAEMRKLMQDIVRDPQFLWSRPILANRVGDELTVYAGNQRLEACRNLGIDEVPVIVSDNLSEDQLRTRMAMDNIHFGYFDNNKLTAFLDTDLDVLGISDDSDVFNFGEDYKKGDVDTDEIFQKNLKNKGDTRADIEENSESGLHAFVMLFDSEDSKDEFEILAMNLPANGQRFEDWLITKIKEAEE